MGVKSTLLKDSLAIAVPIKIAEFQEKGGPGDYDIEEMRRIGEEIAEHGDALLFREKRETARLWGRLVFALSVMAFFPGGVTFLGDHWNAEAVR